VTPFRNGNVDEPTFASLVEYQVREGSQGVVVNGTTGEPSLLTAAERSRLVWVAVEAAEGRIPILAATGSQSLDETVWLTKEAEAAGAAAALVVTPYYVRPPQRGLVEYFVQVSRATSLPLLLYNIPGRAAVSAEVSTIVEIAEKVPTFVGMKHAANDLGLVSDVLAQLGPEFRLFCGLEDLSFPMLAIGACGLVNAVGNLAPNKVAELCEVTAAGLLEPARRAHYDLRDLNRAIFFDTNPIPLKYMMVKLGLLPNEEHRLPMMPADPVLAGRLDAVLEGCSVLLAGSKQGRA
jgi:4-hydroxy-tetrahydrodipicolinate synthase